MVVVFSVYSDDKEVFNASDVEKIVRGFFTTTIILKNGTVKEYGNASYDVIAC